MIILDILIKKQELNKCSHEITNGTEVFQAQINEFNSIIDSINTVWNGADALKYINIMKEKYVVALNEMKNCIDDYGLYLKNVSEVYGILDDVFSSKNIDV